MFGRRDDPSAHVLRRHFLDNLIFNDLVSPDADRHAVLALTVATACSVVLFVTTALSMPYLFTFVQLPGPTAVGALEDRALLFGGSMVITALVTLVVWEHLAIDPRDSLILGHLPIPAETIVRAKLMALVQFVATYALAVNVIPAVIYPAFLIANLALHLGHLLWMMIAHAITGLLASAFGFFGVFAIRGVLRSTLGAQLFGRVSAMVQSTLATVTTVALLLLPIWSAHIVTTEMPPGGSPYNAPPLWFVGVNEAATGDIIVNSRLEIEKLKMAVTRLARINDTDARGRAHYRNLQPTLRTLGAAAAIVLPLLGVIAFTTYYLTNRRLPLPVSWTPASNWVRDAKARVLSLVAPRHPTARASFFFALETLAGSAPHRLGVVIALALGVAALVIALYAAGLSALASPSLPRGVMGGQLAFTVALLLGFRNAVRVPAELAANWMIQLSWAGDRTAFIDGVKRSALVMFVVPSIAAFFAINVTFYHPADAMAHLVCSLLVAWLLLDASLLGYSKLPFTAPLRPGRHVRIRGFFVFFGAVLGCRSFATFERDALQDAASLALLVATLVAAIALVGYLDRRSSRTRPEVSFAEPPHALLEVGLGDLVGRT